MQFLHHYHSPLGTILLSADDIGIAGLWLEGQKYYARTLDSHCEEAELSLFSDAEKWLDLYFSGIEPDFSLPLHPAGTAFQKEVWDILLTIPYGKTLTYGAIAKQLAAQKGLSHMSAQAVGSAVGHNPISILIPCHRVLGTTGSLTGYAGGLDRKTALLELEGILPKQL